MNFHDKIKLSDENFIPTFGFGCWNAYGDEIKNAVACALNEQYRYIDSASRYNNEVEVGLGIRDSGVLRDEIFILSKLWPLDFDKPQVALEKSLFDLNCDYLDCYLLHWPGSDDDIRSRAIDSILPLQGTLYKTFGVSNFQIEHLKKFKDEFGFYPAVNQIELHPFYQERELTSFCKDNNIALIAWGPLYRARGMESDVIQELSRKYSKTPAQILLRWQLQKGHIPIPKSKDPQRIKENRCVFDFDLSNDDMHRLDSLDSNLHIGADPYTFNG
ncbi:MAG: aldo/keto reductase [Clostridia bacterium]|nr:aldo/keto reductase [Clostridia bacterium]